MSNNRLLKVSRLAAILCSLLLLLVQTPCQTNATTSGPATGTNAGQSPDNSNTTASPANVTTTGSTGLTAGTIPSDSETGDTSITTDETTPGAHPQPDQMDQVRRAVSQMPAIDYIWLIAVFLGGWVLGWIVLRALVPKILPGHAGWFGCAAWIGVFLLFLTFCFFGHILPAALPGWIVWLVVILLVFWLLVLGIRSSRPAGWVAFFCGFFLLFALTAWWFIGKQNSEAIAESSPNQPPPAGFATTGGSTAGVPTTGVTTTGGSSTTADTTGNTDL